MAALVATPFARALADETETDAGDGDAPVGPGTPDPAQLALTEAWAAGAVGFVRGAGEHWLARRAAPGSPTREVLTAQVAAWLWAGPVGLLARERTRTPVAPPAPHAPAPTHVTDAPTSSRHHATTEES